MNGIYVPLTHENVRFSDDGIDLGIFVMSCVFPAGKIFDVGENWQTCQPNFLYFKPAMLMGTINIYHLIPL